MSKYNLNLLNAISEVKSGQNVSLTLYVSKIKTNNKVFKTALNQWAKFFNYVYSSANGCAGSLNLNFETGSKGSESKVFTLQSSIKDEESLSKAIILIGINLGISLKYNFLSQDYILHFTASTDKFGNILDNCLVKDKDILRAVYSIYGNPKFKNPVIYGPTNSSALNYNAVANKDDGTGIFDQGIKKRSFIVNRNASSLSGGYIAISNSNSYYNLSSDGLFKNEFSGPNVPSGIPTTSYSENSEYKYFTESFTAPDEGEFVGITFYYNNAADFNANTRLGDSLNRDAGDVSEDVYRKNSSNSTELAYYNSSYALCSSNVHAITMHSIDNSVTKTSILYAGATEYQYSVLNSNLTNFLDNGEVAYDCENPEIPFGNLANSNAFNYLQVFKSSTLFTKNMNIGQEDLRFRIIPNEGEDYLTSSMFFNDGINQPSDAVNLPENAAASVGQFLQTIKDLGGDLDGWWHFDPPSSNTSYGNLNAGKINTNYFLSPEHPYIQRSPLVQIQPNKANNKILSLFSEQSPYNFNGKQSRPEGLQDWGSLTFGWGDFKSVATSNNNKGYQGTYLHFDLDTAQTFNQTALSQINHSENLDVEESLFNNFKLLFGEYSYKSGTDFLNVSILNYHYFVKPDGQLQYNLTNVNSTSNTLSNYSYMKGFTFDIESEPYNLGIYQIAKRKFNYAAGSNSNFYKGSLFLEGTFCGFSATSSLFETTNPNTLMGEVDEVPSRGTGGDSTLAYLSRAAIAMSFRKKSILGTQMGSPQNNPFHVMMDADPDTIGCYVVAYGIPHGIILMYMNEYGQFLPLEDSGVELHIPGGKYEFANVNNPVTATGGFTPLSMVFSPFDNYLYTIVENPETFVREICIYNVSTIALGQKGTDAIPILESAISIPNPFSGELTRVDRGDDGSIYFFSHNSNEYIQITNPDSSISVQNFANFYTQFIRRAQDNFDFLPTMSSSIVLEDWLNSKRHKVLSEEEKVDIEDVLIMDTPEKVAYSYDQLSDSIFNLKTLQLDYDSDDSAGIPSQEGGEGAVLPDKDVASYTYQNLTAVPKADNPLIPGGTYPNMTVPVNTMGDYIISGISGFPIMYILKYYSGNSLETATHSWYNIYDGYKNILKINSTPEIAYNGGSEDAQDAYISYRDRYSPGIGSSEIEPDGYAGGTPFVVTSVTSIAGATNLLPGSKEHSQAYPNANFVAYYAFSVVDGSITNEHTEDSRSLMIHPFIYTQHSGPTGENFGNNQGYEVKAFRPSTIDASLFGINREDYIINGVATIKINPASSWLIVCSINSASNHTSPINLHFNKVDSNFDVSDLNNDSTNFNYRNISFSNHVSHNIGSLGLRNYKSGFRNVTADHAKDLDFSLYPNSDGSKFVVILRSPVKTEGGTAAQNGEQIIYFYNFNKETADITLVECFPSTKFIKRTFANANDFDSHLNVLAQIKKVVYSTDSSVVYMLVANISGEAGFQQTPIIKFDLTSIENQGGSTHGQTSNLNYDYVDFVQPFPNIPSEGWPIDFNNENFSPSYNKTAGSFYSNGKDRYYHDDEWHTPPNFIVDNIFLSTNHDVYISSRCINDSKMSEIADSLYPSIGRITNSNYFDDAKYALNAIKISSSKIKDSIFGEEEIDIAVKEAQPIVGCPPVADGSTTVHDITDKLPFETFAVSGCTTEYNYIGVASCNYNPSAEISTTCIYPPHNGPITYGGTGYVDNPADPNYVECNCGENIEPVCSTCYTGEEAPDPTQTCGVCTDPEAINYNDPDYISTPFITDNSRCQYGYCATPGTCNYESTPPVAPNGGTMVPDETKCITAHANCDCAGELLEGYCGVCGQSTYLQQGKVEGYCGCNNTFNDIPTDQLSEYQISSIPNYFDGKYCDCLGNIPAGDYCDCNGTPIEKVYMGGIFQQNSEKPCNCEGETSEQLHGPYCGCTGQVNVSGACDCNNMPVSQYVDNDGDGLGVAPAVPLCPVVNEDGSLSPQPGYSFVGGDISDDCAGEYDECGECRLGGFDDPEFCSDGEDQCGVCCGNDDCLDCHGVPNGPGQLPNNPCPGYKYCECSQTYILIAETCPTINEGCGCGQGPVTECGDCQGPDSNDCCSGTHYDSCLKECVDITIEITTEDLCGNCFASTTDPDFNSCVGCMDDNALNYDETATVACNSCCEFETYVAPQYDMQPDGPEGQVASSFLSGLTAIPENYPQGGMFLSSIHQRPSFDFDSTEVDLDNYPECVSTGSCNEYIKATIQINNLSFSDKIQMINADNLSALITNAGANGELIYTTDFINQGGMILNISGPSAARYHYSVGGPTSDALIKGSAFYFNHSTNEESLLQLPSSTILRYKPKFYFTLSPELNLNTFDPATLFYQYRNVIDKIVSYTIPSVDAQENDSRIKSLENAISPIQTTIYDPALNVSIPLNNKAVYGEGQLKVTDVDNPTAQGIDVYQVYEVTPKINSSGTGYEEFTLLFAPFLSPEPDPEETNVYTCCAQCSSNFGVILGVPYGGTSTVNIYLAGDAQGNAYYEIITLGADPSLNLLDPITAASALQEIIDYGGYYSTENELISGVGALHINCDSSVCVDCTPSDPCNGSYEIKCNNPGATNYVGSDYVLQDCELFNDSACNFNCTGLVVPEDSPGVEGVPSCANKIQVCTDQSAINFFAVPSDDTACCYESNYNLCEFQEAVYGCTNKNACNYNPLATEDDGSCDLESCVGCTDPNACNYDVGATIPNNESCVYPEEGFECSGEPIEPPNPNPDDPLEPSTGWRIRTTINTSNINTTDEINKLQWFIYGESQTLIKQSPHLSEYTTSEYILHHTTEINDIMSNSCMWFLPLGVEENNIWEHVVLEILTPSGQVYHSIRKGFTLTDTGSKLLKQNSQINCSFGCSQETFALNTEHCIKYIKEDTDEFTDITVQVETPTGGSFSNYTDVKIKIINVDSNEVLSEISSLFINNVFTDSFRLLKDTKLAVMYINPNNYYAPAELKLLGEFGELITKKDF